MGDYCIGTDVVEEMLLKDFSHAETMTGITTGSWKDKPEKNAHGTMGVKTESEREKQVEDDCGGWENTNAVPILAS